MWKKWKDRISQLFEKEQPEIYKIPRFISEDSLLQLTADGWSIGKRKLKPEDLATLKLEAKEFEGSFIWRLMRNDIHYMAYLQATAKRRTDADAIYAGAMYRDLEILETFLEQCKKL
jgi:hypothetical protein